MRSSYKETKPTRLSQSTTVFIGPIDKRASETAIENIRDQLAQAGFACDMERREEKVFIAFSQQRSQLEFSSPRNVASHGIVHYFSEDGVGFEIRLLEALKRIGWICEDEPL